MSLLSHYSKEELARSASGGASGDAAWYSHGTLGETAQELDLARVDASVAQAAAALEESGLDEAAAARGAAGYAKRKPSLRAVLDETLGAPLSQLADIEWRLDYVVRTSGAGNKPALVPIYYVKLLLAEAPTGTAAPTTKAVSLTLTFEQMNDFLLMVRDANHQASRMNAA